MSAPPCPLPTVRFYDFDDFRIDVQRRQLLRRGEPVAIKPKAVDTLVALIEHRGRIVEKEELMGRLWPDTVVEEANLTQNIFVVRKALGEVHGQPKFIDTIARRGYRFIADVTEVEGEERGVRPTKALSRARSRHRWLVTSVLSGVFLLFLAALALTVSWDFGRASGAAAPIQSVAVLPFEDLSAGGGHEYFAEGMTDAIITDLATVAALRVISHQSVKRFRGSQAPLRTIARSLGADAIVEGSIMRSGPRVRLTVQLIDARTDQHLWAASYDRDLDDVLVLQGELAGAVVRAVSASVAEHERTALVVRRAVDPEAYDLYLRGRHFWALRSEEALRKSIDSFQQAIHVDPSFAQAHAGTALAYAPLGYFGYVPADEAYSKLRAAALKALELDPSSVDAQVALAAELGVYQWKWDAALAEWQRILARSPNHPVARLWYGFALEKLGRLDEALIERRRARDSDPLSLQFNTSVATTLDLLGRRDDAIAGFRRALELEPRFAGAHQGLGVSLLLSGEYEEALAELQEAALPPNDARSLALLGYAYGVTGRSAAARELLDEIARRARARYVPPLLLAYVHIGIGENEAAFAQLEASLLDRSPMLTHAKIDPLLDSLREDERFTHLLRRMNLIAD